MSDSFGQRLRVERERRNIPLTSISNRTKISLTLLEGLERDDLSKWPVGIFRRSFVRMYADAVGLEPEALVREFQALFPDPHEPRAESRRLDAPRAVGPSTLRLTLADSWSPFTGGFRLIRLRGRWIAAAWDFGVLVALATTAFVVFDRFWAALAVSSLLYYLGGILVLGNTLGVCLFGPAKRAGEPAADAHPQDQTPAQRRDPLRLVRRA